MKRRITDKNILISVTSNDVHLLIDLRIALGKFMTKFGNLEVASYEAVERILLEFDTKQLELLQANIVQTKEFSMSMAVRQTIQRAAKRTITEKNLSRTQKSFAITNTAKYCKMFYKTPKCKCV